MGEAKRRKQIDANYGKVRNPKHIAPPDIFVICNPEREEYFCQVKKALDTTYLSWTDHPLNAKKFTSSESAKSLALKLVAGKDNYDLLICRIEEIPDKKIKVTEVSWAMSDE
jgi:hypothetical protein